MNVCVLWMLYFNRIEVSKGIDVSKTSVSKECDICHYWCFLNYSFKFQPNVCNINLWTLKMLLFQTLQVLIIAVLLA